MDSREIKKSSDLQPSIRVTWNIPFQNYSPFVFIRFLNFWAWLRCNHTKVHMEIWNACSRKDEFRALIEKIETCVVWHEVIGFWVLQLLAPITGNGQYWHEPLPLTAQMTSKRIPIFGVSITSSEWPDQPDHQAIPINKWTCSASGVLTIHRSIETTCEWASFSLNIMFSERENENTWAPQFGRGHKS